MKITCQACQAKYTIADEKVVGKIVKIRCKKCGATIVVNGNEASALGAGHPPATANAFDDEGRGIAATPWTVNVADGDQRTLNDEEIVAAYRAGVVTDETLCWKEGQPDWLPIHEIAPLHSACVAAGARGHEEEHHVATSDEGDGGLSRGAAGAREGRSGRKDGNGAAAGAQPAATMAARRAGGRIGAADLFGSVAQAGGEDEVLTSAPAGAAQGKTSAAQSPSMTATNEASGLIDIRQLGAQMRSNMDDSKKKSRVDDIMNLGGGGAFSPSLAAPVLAAPSLEHYSEPPPSLLGGPGAAQVKSKALIFLALGAGTFFLVAAVAIAVVLVRGKGLVAAEDGDKTSVAANTSPSPGMSAASTTPQPSAVAAPEPTSANAAREPAPPATVAQDAPRQEAPRQEAPRQEAPPPRKEFKEFKAPAAAPREAPAASGAEFNMGEARSRLAAIVGGLQSCKRADTTGSGKVEIVFAPSGGVQSAALMQGSPFDGTPTGKCVEARFRQARVPPFGGGPFPVTKSFSIN
jgi:predicted Zn finger-like uncharacterized protein